MPAIIRHWISARPVMLAGIVDGGGDEAAEVGDEPLGAGEPDVVLDHLVDRPLDVALLLAQLLVGGLRGRRQRADPLDGPGERLAHERRGQPRRDAGDARGQLLAHRALHTHAPDGTGRVGGVLPCKRPGLAARSTGHTHGSTPSPLRCGPCGWSRLGVTGGSRVRRGSTRTTTWSRRGRTSRRGRCWRPTGAGCSRCRRAGVVTRCCGSHPYAAACCRWTGCGCRGRCGARSAGSRSASTPRCPR